MTEVIGLSTVPTGYRVIFPSGLTSFVRCGADIVLTGINRDLTAEAKCPMCASSIQLRFHNSKLEGLTVAEALLYVVELGNVTGGRSSVMCEGTNLFDREECLDAWLENYHGISGTRYTVQGYSEHVLASRKKTTG